MNNHVCESCGMPMKRNEDFGGGNSDKKYCVHCTDNLGELKSYDDILTGMTEFAMKTMGVSREEAQKTALDNMKKMPAWKEYFN